LELVVTCTPSLPRPLPRPAQSCCLIHFTATRLHNPPPTSTSAISDRLPSPSPIFQGCGIILRVVKSRQPLLQASKLLYRLSKDTANDALFRKEKLLEPLLRTVRGRGSEIAREHA
jgi:hypothetical protein